MSNSKRRCVALNCPGTASQTHRFPKDLVRCQIWAERAGCLHLLEKGVETMNTNYRLCSDHFNDKSYTSTERKRLTNYALPEIFSHQSEFPCIRSAGNVDLLCRTCASVCEDLIPVFGERGLDMQLVEKIHTHLPIMVTPEDGMPSAICMPCADKLAMCHEFVYSCLQADATLRSILCMETTDEQNKEEENAEPTDSEVEKEQEIFAESLNHEVSSDQVQQCEAAELKTSGVNPKFKVVVMKMKNTRNLSSDAQMEKALSLLKNLDSTPPPSMPSEQQVVQPSQETELSGLESSDIEIPDDLTACLLNESSSTSLPVLSNEDTKSIDIKPLSTDICDNTISSAFVEINKNPSSKTPIDYSEQLVYSCGYCEKTVIGKKELEVHKKNNHPDKVFCCPDCDVVIYESKEIFEEHIKIHLNERAYIGVSNVNWRDTDLDKESEFSSVDVKLMSGNNEFEIPKASFNSDIGTKLSSKFIPIQQEEGALKIVSVADVHVEPGKQSEKDGQFRGNSKLRMKVSKDFEKIENKLKSKIIGAIKGIIKTKESSVDRNKYSTDLHSESMEKSQNSKHWSCQKCKHISLSWGEHIQHHHAHPSKPFQCTYCVRAFSSKSKFDSHISMHTQEKQFICEYCGKRFRSNQNLKNHLHIHGAGDRTFECKECGKTFPTRGGYESHCSSHAEASYLCHVCGKSMKHLSSLRLHHLSHVDPEFFIKHCCLVCGKTCQNRYLLKEHMNVHTNIRPYKCPHCVKSFHKRAQLRQHVAIHLNARQHKCPVCGKGFNRSGNMKAHAQRHQHSTCYMCKLCKTTFTSLGELISHRKSHRNKDLEQSVNQQAKQNAHVCSICGKKLASKLTLKYHTMMHSDIKPFSCDVCGKMFAIKGKLRLHRKIHNSEKSFPCHFCDEGFHTKQLKIIHERIHTGEKPFQCKDCNKAFRSRMSLNQHVLVHSDARPFKCSQCDKSFRRRDTLDTHLRTHTGERPYSCQLCKRSFKQKGDCNKHLRTHFKGRHKVDVQDYYPAVTFSCILCGQNFSLKDDLDIHFGTFHATDVIVASSTLMINSETLVTLPGIMADDQKPIILSNLGSCLETT